MARRCRKHGTAASIMKAKNVQRAVRYAKKKIAKVQAQAQTGHGYHTKEINGYTKWRDAQRRLRLTGKGTNFYDHGLGSFIMKRLGFSRDAIRRGRAVKNWLLAGK